MATFAGKGGSVKIGANTVAEIDEWTLTTNADLNEISKFGDAAKSFTPGLYEWNGHFKGRLDMTDTNGQLAIFNQLIAGTILTALHLGVAGTTNFNGNAWTKTAAFTEAITENALADYTFQ